MKTLAAVAVVAALGSLFLMANTSEPEIELTDDDFYSKFLAFVADYGKQYLDREEMTFRFSLFKDTLIKIIKHNGKGGNLRYGINEFADLTDMEYEVRNGFINHTPPEDAPIKSFAPMDDIPDRVDHRDAGIVTEVQDQGACGSCWSFAAAGVLESQIMQ